MSLFHKSSILSALVLAGLQIFAPAQAPYPYPYPPTQSYLGRGGQLAGQADVMNAYGGVITSQEQARTMREQANQAKLDTKRKTFDEMMYEKANTPAYTQELEKSEAMILRRMMTHPTEGEITSGKAQNTMLPFLNKLARDGIQGPPVPLNPAELKTVNVTVGSGGHNIGILKDGGDLDWPLGLRGPTQKKLADVLPSAVSQAAMGTLDLKTYNDITKQLTKLQDETRLKFQHEEIDAGLYLEGKRFLSSLDSAVKALRQPSAAKLLNGTYAASGRNVPELVFNMSQKGLQFAPATPGNEAPYYALQNAMVAYASGAQESAGFRLTPTPAKPRDPYAAFVKK